MQSLLLVAALLAAPQEPVERPPGMPLELMDRLAKGEDPLWTEAFIRGCDTGALESEVLEFLAPRAIRGCRTTEERRRMCELISLKDLRRSAIGLLPWIQGPCRESAGHAAQALARMKSWESVPWLVGLLREPKADPHGYAVSLLEGLKAPETVPLLVPLLEDPRARVSAAFLLGVLDAREAAPRIERLLDEEGSYLCCTAVMSLVRLRATASVPRLIGLLRDEDEEIRRCAATALRELDAREAALPLRALLRDPNERVIAAAARALGSFGAREAIPEILPLLRHEDGDVRAVAIGALGALEAKAAAEPLLAILRDPGYGGRLDVAEALAQIGGRAAIPALVGVLSEGDGMARVEVIQAFARMGAREAVPDLLRLLKDEDAAVVKAAVEALVDLGASECVPRVARLLGDPDDSLVELAVGALEVFGAKGAVRDVARGLACELPATRERLLKILAAADGREAIPAILPLLGDPALRDLAAEILCRWGVGEGVGVLLEQEREFGLLNAAAEPDLWKRLQAPTPCLAGDLRQQIDLLADLAGLPIVEWPDDADGEEEVRSHPEATIFDTLRALLDQENLHMILTPEGILAVDGAHALEYWRGWWESRRPR